jgi:hypothetical protein
MLGRSCFYPGERLSLEPANTLAFSHLFTSALIYRLPAHSDAQQDDRRRYALVVCEALSFPL